MTSTIYPMFLFITPIPNPVLYIPIPDPITPYTNALHYISYLLAHIPKLNYLFLLNYPTLILTPTLLFIMASPLDNSSFHAPTSQTNILCATYFFTILNIFPDLN